MPLESEAIVLNLDKPRPLRLTLMSLRAYEEKFGRSALEADTTRFTDVTQLLWAALISGDPELTFEAVVNIGSLESVKVLDVMEAVTKCVKRDFGIKERLAGETESPLADEGAAPSA
jgi:hypothetical protein